MEVLEMILFGVLNFYMTGVFITLVIFTAKILFIKNESKIGDFKIFFNMFKSWYYVPTAYKDFINTPKYSLMDIGSFLILSIIVLSLITTIIYIIYFFNFNLYLIYLEENLCKIMLYFTIGMLTFFILSIILMQSISCILKYF